MAFRNRNRSTTMRPLISAALALLLAASPAFAEAPRSESKVLGSITAEAGQTYGSLDSVNGAIDVREDARVSEAQTVNGAIRIGAKADVGEAATVNGSISADAQARLGSAETVNGSIRLARQVQVREDVEAVNGSIELGEGASVGGDARTVNGRISLDGARVAGVLRTAQGDISLAGASEAGGIMIDKEPRSWLSFGRQTPPTVTVGAGSKVTGPMVFEREVRLFVHESATIGDVSGATAVRYAGRKPPNR